MASPFEVIIGRIETLDVDAVVNAALPALTPSDGIDAALRSAAGPDLTAHTDGMAPIAIGDAVLTPGFKLPARHIIHVAPPVWSEGEEGAKVAALAHCYINAIKLAQTQGLAAIAFPCLGNDSFGWPRGFACAIAIAACEQALEAAPGVTRVVFCCTNGDDAQLYRAGLR